MASFLGVVHDQEHAQAAEVAEVGHFGAVAVGVPQFLSIVTVGARDMAALRAFYRSWGWREVDESSDGWCAFDMGGCLLSIYPIDLLGDAKI